MPCLIHHELYVESLPPFSGVEPLDRLHQPNVAFIDEIGQRQAKPLVIERDLHDQTQVRVDHPLPRLVVSLPDAFGQTHLLLGGNAVEMADFAKVDFLRSVLGGVPHFKTGQGIVKRFRLAALSGNS